MRALRTHGPGGPWLHTGDLGYLDEDSFLFIVDRQKDLIKTSGYQVWPREIEEVLAGHPGVQEVGVAGVPNAVKGEVVKAWVVKRSGMNPTVDELRAFCRRSSRLIKRRRMWSSETRCQRMSRERCFAASCRGTQNRIET